MERGRLKIFFGYSAGVGKTYAMLKEGHKLKDEGIDVVLGYFEPHERPNTMRLQDGLEALPLKEILYKGIVLHEFDVDAAIKRRPDYILVDELAHTNAKGSKNTKRFLDVLELLNNGINVYTTVNVQHIETLNDIIASKTEVLVNERIPDDIFDLADEIKLIDIEPVDLIERMLQGKIYKKERINLALSNFFKEDNLNFLRELTMRKMADRLAEQKNNGQKPSKYVVLISPSPSSAKNIRVCARMASVSHSSFTALYVETNNSLSNESAFQLKKHMNLVKDLNGDIIVKYSDDVIEAIVDFVRVSGVTNLVIGKTWESIGKKIPFENKIIARLPDIEVLIVPDHQSVRAPKKTIFTYLKNLSKKNCLEKYRLANRTLDGIKAINHSLDLNDIKGTLNEIINILARFFERSVDLKIKGNYYREGYKGEDTSFFNSIEEIEAANWAFNNKMPAGRGTNTLRNIKGIYFPIIYKNEALGVLGLSCQSKKMLVTDKLLFMQIHSTLALILWIIKANSR